MPVTTKDKSDVQASLQNTKQKFRTNEVLLCKEKKYMILVIFTNL